METRARGHVKIQVGVVHAVQAPQQRHGVEHHVLQIDRQVQRQHREHDYEEVRKVEEVEQPHPALGGKSGHANGGHRKDRPDQHTVKDRDSQVVGPAHRLVHVQKTPRRHQLP